MKNELKIFRLTDRIMKYGDGQVSYNDALECAKKYYSTKTSLYDRLISHTGTEDLGRWLGKELQKTL